MTAHDLGDRGRVRRARADGQDGGQLVEVRQALNYLLGQLETLGYLERRDASGDQRLGQIYLTARGHQAMAAIREVVAQGEAEWEKELGPGDFSKLRDLLTALDAIAGGTAGETRSGP